MHVIYEPKGAAREYAALAVNLYDGCSHGCTYCYAPRVLRADPAKWSSKNPQPRKPNMLELLDKDLETLKTKYPDDRPEILLCFTCDPYHGGDTQLTRDALLAIGEAGFKARILTKGGGRAARDFDVMDEYGFRFGVSFSGREDLEPWAASTRERMEYLHDADRRCIKTWVSFEPVLDLDLVYWTVAASKYRIDEWHFGALSGGNDGIDWHVEAPRLKAFLDGHGVRYKFKKSLIKYVEEDK